MQVKLKVTGRVQGVGFRMFVERKAREHGIKGWVRNTSDGAVKILAEGDLKDLETFIDWVKQGPSLSRVTHVEKSVSEQTFGMKEFTIKY